MGKGMKAKRGKFGTRVMRAVMKKKGAAGKKDTSGWVAGQGAAPGASNGAGETSEDGRISTALVGKTKGMSLKEKIEWFRKKCDAGEGAVDQVFSPGEKSALWGQFKTARTKNTEVNTMWGEVE